jgi:hypothetical protein
VSRSVCNLRDAASGLSCAGIPGLIIMKSHLMSRRETN